MSGAGNLVSGNDGVGVLVVGREGVTTTTTNTVQGNLIGVNVNFKKLWWSGRATL